MPSWLSMNLQNSNSPIMEQLIFFHDYSMMFLMMIISLISYFMNLLLMNMFMNKYFLSSELIEIIWTIIPAMILLFIAFPSLQLLYLLDDVSTPLISLKSIGHQWYWQYEFTNFKNLNFDSYMDSKNKIKFRLFNVDNLILIPNKIQIRILTTSTDVIHSWTIPSLGVKIDASPSRLNQVNFFINRLGLYFGQCSEICGANHSFMPIVLESTKLKNFLVWINNNLLFDW